MPWWQIRTNTSHLGPILLVPKGTFPTKPFIKEGVQLSCNCQPPRVELGRLQHPFLHVAITHSPSPPIFFPPHPSSPSNSLRPTPNTRRKNASYEDEGERKQVKEKEREEEI